MFDSIRQLNDRRNELTDSSPDPLSGLPQPKTASQRSPLNTPSEPGGDRWWLKESLAPEELSPEETLANGETESTSKPTNVQDQLDGPSTEEETESSSVYRPDHLNADHIATSAPLPEDDDTTSSEASKVIPLMAIVSVTVVLWLGMGHIWGIGVGLALGSGYLFTSKGAR